MADFDAAVIGAGHNGLVCAAYLARAGRRVLVLEAAERIGGMTRSEELVAPEYLSDVHASGYLVAKLTPAPEELGLALRLTTPDPNWAHVFPDGRRLVIRRDPADTCRDWARFSARDAETWGRLYAQYRAAKPSIVADMLKEPETLAATLAAPGGAEGFRARMLSGRAFAEETFESPELRLFFTSAGLHNGLAPDDPMGGAFAWLFAAAIQDVGCSVVCGGMGTVASSLAAAVAAHGGAIRTGARVAAIESEAGHATGLRLVDGERIAIDGPVAVNADPRHLVLDLLGAAAGPEITEQIGRYAFGPSFFVIHVALDAPVGYKAGPDADAAAYVHASELSIDALADTFVAVRAGRLPDRPMLGIIDEARRDPGRAPAGRGLMKFVVHFVPYALVGPDGTRSATHWDSAREAYADRILAWADEAFLPGLVSRITARCVHSPLDLERGTLSSVHGTHMHGAYLPWQAGAFRPLPAMGRYRAPVGGVYLCGSGSHPGSGVSMAPGRNAARAICSDLGLAFPGA